MLVTLPQGAQVKGVAGEEEEEGEEVGVAEEGVQHTQLPTPHKQLWIVSMLRNLDRVRALASVICVVFLGKTL